MKRRLLVVIEGLPHAGDEAVASELRRMLGPSSSVLKDGGSTCIGHLNSSPPCSASRTVLGAMIEAVVIAPKNSKEKSPSTLIHLPNIKNTKAVTMATIIATANYQDETLMEMIRQFLPHQRLEEDPWHHHNLLAVRSALDPSPRDDRRMRKYRRKMRVLLMPTSRRAAECLLQILPPHQRFVMKEKAELFAKALITCMLFENEYDLIVEHDPSDPTESAQRILNRVRVARLR